MADHVHKPTFHGAGGSLFGIYLVNTLLTIVTLGIYSFWGKTRLRAYLYSQTEFDGDRFAYHGTGGELFKGWLKAMGLVVATVAVAALLAALTGRFGEILAPLAVYGVIFCVLFPMALAGARSYRLSRTSWRGIRFSFRGDWEDLAAVFIPGVLLTTVTLGFYYPYFHANVRRFLVDESHFGDQAFEFDGQGSDLFGRHVLAMFLIPLTLGIYWFWYHAYRQRYYWAHTSIAGARFHSEVTGERLLVLSLTNALLLMVTLGIAFPWVKVRTMRFECDQVSLEATEELAAVRQRSLAATATGEGLTALMDVELAGADFFGL